MRGVLESGRWSAARSICTSWLIFRISFSLQVPVRSVFALPPPAGQRAARVLVKAVPPNHRKRGLRRKVQDSHFCLPTQVQLVPQLIEREKRQSSLRQWGKRHRPRAGWWGSPCGASSVQAVAGFVAFLWLRLAGTETPGVLGLGSGWSGAFFVARARIAFCAIQVFVPWRVG